MKRFAALILFWTSCWSAAYDPFLIDIQLSLIPKIAMLEKSINATSSKVPVRMLIAYDSADEETAKTSLQILSARYNGFVRNHPLIATALPFERLENLDTYQIIYVLNASPAQLKRLHGGISSKAVTALYNAEKLGTDGMLFSIRMERTPVILINAKVLRENRLSFPDSLLEIARIIE